MLEECRDNHVNHNHFVIIIKIYNKATLIVPV